MLIVAYPRGVSTCVAQVLLNRLAEVLGGVRLDKIFKAAEVRTDHGKGYAKSYEVPKGCVTGIKGRPEGNHPGRQAATAQKTLEGGLGDRHKLVGYAVAAILAFAAIAVMAAGLLWGKKRKKVEAAEGEGVE